MITQEGFDLATKKATGEQKRAIRKAKTAGVPLVTILGWLIQYGPTFLAVIESLIEKWKKKNG